MAASGAPMPASAWCGAAFSFMAPYQRMSVAADFERLPPFSKAFLPPSARNVSPAAQLLSSASSSTPL